MTVFKAMLLIRDIDDRKNSDLQKEIAKLERKEALGLLPEPVEEVKEEEVKKAKPGAKKKKVVEPDPEELERIRLLAEFEKELIQYGRTWIWEGYFNEPEHKADWMDAAEKMRHINIQVLQDIEDHILLDGFNEQDEIRSTKFNDDVGNKITKHLQESRERAKMNLKEEEKEFVEETKAEDKKRKFAEPFRPNNKIWNFIEEANPTPHVLRAGADPNAAYIDGRVGKLLEIINKLGIHIKNYQSENWKMLNNYTQKIFYDEEEDTKDAYKEWLEKEGQQ